MPNNNNYNFNQLKKNLNKLGKKKNFNQPRKINKKPKMNVKNNKPKMNVKNNKPKMNVKKPNVANKVKSINNPSKKVRFKEFEKVNKSSSNLSNYVLVLFLIVISALCGYLLYEIYNTKSKPIQPQPVFQYSPNKYSKKLNKYIVKQNKYIMDINDRVKEINKCRLHSSKYLRDKAILSSIRENERKMANEVALQQQYEPVLY